MYQESGMRQALLAAKAQLVKKKLSMPRLELISAHMAATLVDNIRSGLEGYVDMCGSLNFSSNLICRRMKRVCTSVEEEPREATLSTYHKMPC